MVSSHAGSCFCCSLLIFSQKNFRNTVRQYQSLVTVTLNRLGILSARTVTLNRPWYTVSQNCHSQQWLVSQNSHSLVFCQLEISLSTEACDLTDRAVILYRLWCSVSQSCHSANAGNCHSQTFADVLSACIVTLSAEADNCHSQHMLMFCQHV